MTQIKLRRDTSTAFASSNPILGNGEPAYETDTKKLKIGDGTTAYTQLEYFSAGGGSTNITATLPLKIVDGVISLEVDGQTIQIVDGKLHANLDELSNTVNTLSDDVGTAFDLINIAQTDIQSNTENITNLQNALPNKEDKFSPELPLAINSVTITTTVPEGVTETAESWTGGTATDKKVIVDVSALKIKANSNWKLHLSGYIGNYKDSGVNTSELAIDTDNGRIFNTWLGSNRWRLGFGSGSFLQIPDQGREFYYEIIYKKDSTQYTFDGTALTSTNPLNIADMATAMSQSAYSTLENKGNITNISIPLYSLGFQRIDKDISKSYFEADGVKYPITSVQGANTLKLAIGSGLSVVDGKLTSTGGDKVTVLSNEYTTISPVPTNGVWYKSQGNGYIVARFMSSGGNQFCQLAVNATGTGSLDNDSIYNQTAFSQGDNNGFTLLLPISSTQYYAVNTNFGKGLQWARFIPFITV